MRLVRYTYPSHRSFSPAAAFARSPWSGLETEIDRLFETALNDLSGSSSAERFPVDIYQDSENTYVRAELPGFRRDDLNVEFTDGVVTVSASRKSGSGENEESVSFTRSINVGDAVDAGKINAAYENGVLTVTLPKREDARPKKITVSVK
jgi:HSP20 family protein